MQGLLNIEQSGQQHSQQYPQEVPDAVHQRRSTKIQSRKMKNQSNGGFPLDFILDNMSKSNEAECSTFYIPQELRCQLQSLSLQENVPLSTVLLAAFLALIQIYANQGEASIAIPLRGLNPETIRVHHMRISREYTVRKLLAIVAKDQLAESPTMQTEQLRTDPSVQLLFSFSDNPPTAEPAVGNQTTCLAIELYFQQSESALNGFIRYRKGSFEHRSIQMLTKHFLNLLASFVENPSQCVEEIDVIDEDERQKLLAWNDTSNGPDNGTMIDLFAHQASTNPENRAVAFRDQYLTYAELDDRSSKLARHLLHLGVRQEMIVAVCMERSPFLIISYLAILKAGGAYLPIDPSYPSERIEFMLTDSGCSIVLAERPSDNLPLLTSVRRLYVEQDWEVIVKEGSSRDIPKVATPASLAYMMYTSGSTGVPKGVLIEQHSVIRLVCNASYFQASTHDRIAQIVNTSFDPSTLEIWSALLNGATLVCISRASTLDLALLEKEVVKHGITAMVAPTALFNQIMINRPALLRPLKCVMFGGEAANPKLVRKFLDLKPRGRLLNLYGITEVTVCSTWFEVTAVSNRVPIGQPIANSRAYVLNHNLKLAPIGAVGELYLAGEGLARGYLHASEERFLINPNAEFQNERMFRTGDLVRRRCDGNLEYLGRVDDMVKIRGHRIELSEVQNAIAEHPAVEECVVTTFGSDSGGKRLVGYVVRNDAEGLQEELISECKLACDEHVYGNIDQEPSDPEFNLAGWINTYDGKSIPKEEMREWLEETLDCIKCLRPKRVLEIGCGTGMILFQIAPQCDSYVGTDLSSAALEYVRKHLQSSDLREKVVLQQGGAHQLEGFTAGQFDTVIINSVVQHFPNAQYFDKVLSNVAPLVSPGGHIFVGDIRGMSLAKYHYLSQAIFAAKESSSVKELRAYIDRKQLADKELLLDPGYFNALKESIEDIHHVRFMPKRSRSLNEMSRYRYQAILHIKCSQAAIQPLDWMDWQRHSLSLDVLNEKLRGGLDFVKEKLCGEEVSYLAISNIPNQRLADEIQLELLLEEAPLTRTYGELQDQVCPERFGGATPDQLSRLAKDAGYEAEISWAQHQNGGVYDVVFWRPPSNHACSPFVMPTYSEMNPHYHSNPLHRKLQQFIPALERFLRTKLPDYMIPAAFVILEAVPLTENGKVDYKALPAPNLNINAINSNYVEPRTALEATLTDIMRTVLGVEQIGIHHSFLTLGGDSISTIEMAALCHKRGLQVSSLTIFKNPTVAMLAEHIESNLGTACVPTKSPSHSSAPFEPFSLLNLDRAQMERIWEVDIRGNGIERAHVEDIYPCVPLQSHVVYETTLDKNAEIHHMFYDIKQPLDIKRLQSSCIRLCEANTVLRTVFLLSAAGVENLNFIQIVIKKENFHPLFKVYECDSAEERDKAIQKHLLEDQEKGIRLGENMLRFALFTTNSGDHQFLWSIHHALMDGWTMQLLMNDLIETYDLEVAPERPPYRNFVRSYLERNHLADKEFWERKLAGVNRQLLPRQQKQEVSTLVKPTMIESQVDYDIQAFCKEHGLTSAALFKAAWVIAVGLYARSNEVLFGDVVFGRNMELDRADEIVGPCFNVLPVRIALNREEKLLALVHRVQEEQNSIYPFENTNVGDIIDLFSDEREMHKIYGSYVAFQNFRSKARKNTDALQISFARICGSIHLTIILEASPSTNGLHMKLTFDENILLQRDAQIHMEMLSRCLEYIVQNPNYSVSALEASFVTS
ncbi:hypothetical protein K493DRAFT_363930 [Basidiobolus meristosporus CBS 931.73]|uniref:Carrier domain-containing protein n=1 Tax=Basidiobolus meristosporus CBS 931.73 TaxID=1314790 RepID=A0A1Y1WRA3_9FUNG|nr:hypothetical protein K493DRAFT_363930 [Basidiobolus meristosporus CBS 931.73]|eukprot:ORX75915.1 hypothetical protein K493DRAFT_363930 [Basidiobolus meristosporus CBS 931.73]